MDRKNVSFDTLRSVGYDPRLRVLRIEFAGASIGHYSGVSADLHRSMMIDSSSAPFFRDSREEEGASLRRMR